MPISPEDFESDVLTLINDAAPERVNEIADIWREHRPRCIVLDDRPGFTFDVRFDHVVATRRALDLVWFATCMCLEATKALGSYMHNSVSVRESLQALQISADPEIRPAIDELASLWSGFHDLREAALPADFTWPDHVIRIPRPDRPQFDTEGQATHDLVGLALAFIFLHEVGHLRYAAAGQVTDPLEEERQCDQFAFNYLLGDVETYSRIHGEPANKVRSKRTLGIGIALSLIQAVGVGNPIGDSHPPPSHRLRDLLQLNQAEPNADCWLVLSCVLVSIALANNVSIDGLCQTTYHGMCLDLVTATNWY